MVKMKAQDQEFRLASWHFSECSPSFESESRSSQSVSHGTQIIQDPLVEKAPGYLEKEHNSIRKASFCPFGEKAAVKESYLHVAFPTVHFSSLFGH